MRSAQQVEPYRVFLSGPGGVGKSHVISLIRNDTVKFLRLSGQVQPEDVVVLLTAPTGVAAFNIQGMTLHSALSSAQLNSVLNPSHMTNSTSWPICSSSSLMRIHSWVQYASADSQTSPTTEGITRFHHIW